MEIHETIEKLLSLSKADDCIVLAQRTSNANVRWANNTTTTNGVSEAWDLAIVSIVGKAVGVINRNYFPEDRLEDLVRESEAACEGKPQAHDYLPLLEGDGAPSDWEAPAARTEVGAFAPITPALADMFGRAASDDIGTFGYAEHGITTLWLATSTGLRKRDERPEGKIEITAKSSDFSRSAWVGQVAHDFDAVDVPAMDARLRKRLAWSEKTIEMPAGHYEVLLEPAATADMALFAYVMSAARDADEGRTVFSKPGGGNRVGEKLYSDDIAIYSDPREPGFEVTPFHVALGSGSYSSVFDNGLDCTKTDWVRDGTLNALITPRYWAQKTGAQPHPFIENLIFAGDRGPSLDEMIARTQRALLVTCFWYIRPVDPQTLLLTGLTRDGVFLVEDGEVKGAVNNFRYNMSPVTMFQNTIEIGKPEATLPREFEFAITRMPPLRVRDFHMSSVSEAT